MTGREVTSPIYEFRLEPALTRGKSVRLYRSGVSTLLPMDQSQSLAYFVYFELSMIFIVAWET